MTEKIAAWRHLLAGVLALVILSADTVLASPNDMSSPARQEAVPGSMLVFEPSAMDVLIVSAFSEGETVVPMYLGGGSVIRVNPDGTAEYVSKGLAYAWYESDEHGNAKGELISEEEFLFNNGCLDYDPYSAGVHPYKEIVSVDGTEVGSQLFFLIVASPGLRFDITARRNTVQNGAVTLTAEIPDDFDTRVADLKNLLPELAAEGLLMERSLTYWGGAAQLETIEGVSAEGKPTLTVRPFSSSTGYANLRYVVQYQLQLGAHYGVVRLYSHPFQLLAAGPSSGLYGASSRFFEAAPLTEAELRNLYATLIAPYRDETKTDPFALLPAQTDATGALTATSKSELFGLINFIRRCSGVDMLSFLDMRKCDFAQAGARYMSDNKVFGHVVAEGKDPDAHEGLMRSNLSSGWWSNGDPYDYIKLQLDQFYDNSAKIMPAMEHRQMLLDNRLISTGLGYMGPTEANDRTYLVTHVDGSELRTTQPDSLEAFPGAGTFPVELMNFKGWTLTLGNNNWTVPNCTELKITITREDGKRWTLSQIEDPSKAYETAGDWFCRADRGEVGSGATILFAPSSIFEGGDYRNTDSLKGHMFTISIEGIVDKHGEDVGLVEYTTEFVSLAKEQVDPKPSAEPSVSAQPSNKPSTEPSAASSTEPSGATSTQPSIQPSPSNQPTQIPTELPAPNVPDVPGYQTGLVGNGTSYVKISGSSTMFYLRNASGKMERVAVPYVKDSNGRRWYPLNHGSTALFPRLENNKVTCYCIYQGGKEIPVVSVTADAKPVVTDGHQTGAVGARTYYVKVSGSSMMFYLRNHAGKLERVAVPYVQDSTGKRWYPVNHGGTALFPVLENGKISAYTIGSGETVLLAA